MKYRILLMGKGKAVMDDFFMHLEDDFEVQTSSERSKDILCHIKYFKPDALVFCLYEETKEIISMVESLKFKLNYYNVPLIIIGNRDECDWFERDTCHMSKLVLTKPILARNIREQITSFLNTCRIKGEVDMTMSEPAAEENGLFEEDWDNIQEYVESVQNGTAPDFAQQETVPEVKEKKHVLVVDDDPMMLKLIKEHLKDSYNVATAINGSVALKFLENKKTNLILLDYEMPVENGEQVLGKIRSNTATADIPVVFLTGVNDPDMVKKVLNLKPQGYLLKPIDGNKLMDFIEKIIG